jgi:hypothetical protein
MHTWNLLVFSGMPVPLCSLKLQMYQNTGQICFCEPPYYGGNRAMMQVFSIISFALLVCNCYFDDPIFSKLSQKQTQYKVLGSHFN